MTQTLQERLREPNGMADSALPPGERAEAADRIDALERALREIAKPKVGPDHDWSENEINKWRATWYAKYEGIARAALTPSERKDG